MSCNYMVPSIIEIVICYIMCGSSDGKLWMACVSSNCILGIMKGVLSHEKKSIGQQPDIHGSLAVLVTSQKVTSV